MKNKKGTSSEKPFSIRLSDGREESFRTSFELWQYVQRYRPNWLSDCEKSAEKIGETVYGEMGASR